MKACLILAVALFGTASADQPTSSYAVLPYENDVLPRNPYVEGNAAPNVYDQSNYYKTNFDTYDNSAGKKKGFSFGRLMRAPFKALKGMFDDAKFKLFELNGSLLRAKGNFLQASGENMLRHAYKQASNGVYYPIEPYHPPSPYHGPVVNHGPIDAHGYNTAHQGPEHHDVSNSIDEYHHHGGSQSSPDHGSHFPHHGGEPSQGAFEEAPSSTYAEVPNHRRQFVEQRSARSFDTPWRTQRSYSGPASPLLDPNPIPVPVPFPVYPSRLIFPSIHQMGGYH